MLKLLIPFILILFVAWAIALTFQGVFSKQPVTSSQKLVRLILLGTFVALVLAATIHQT